MLAGQVLAPHHINVCLTGKKFKKMMAIKTMNAVTKAFQAIRKPLQ
jgi:hypothetical protein